MLGKSEKGTAPLPNERPDYREGGPFFSRLSNRNTLLLHAATHEMEWTDLHPGATREMT